jgi:hypothetical protein
MHELIVGVFLLLLLISMHLLQVKAVIIKCVGMRVFLKVIISLHLLLLLQICVVCFGLGVLLVVDHYSVLKIYIFRVVNRLLTPDSLIRLELQQLGLSTVAQLVVCCFTWDGLCLCLGRLGRLWLLIRVRGGLLVLL